MTRYRYKLCESRRTPAYWMIYCHRWWGWEFVSVHYTLKSAAIHLLFLKSQEDT